MVGETGRLKATIYHNPRCSKSRAALALLREADADVTLVEYLKHPPSPAELSRLYGLARMHPRDGLRTAETAAATLAEADETTILDAMTLTPILIERPLVETAKGVVLARPLERVHDIL